MCVCGGKVLILKESHEWTNWRNHGLAQKNKKKKTQIASLEKEEQSCKYQIPDFKIYYKTVVIKAPA